jgi:hypothetical protein
LELVNDNELDAKQAKLYFDFLDSFDTLLKAGAELEEKHNNPY